jgi:hypothetical protein
LVRSNTLSFFGQVDPEVAKIVLVGAVLLYIDRGGIPSRPLGGPVVMPSMTPDNPFQLGFQGDRVPR